MFADISGLTLGEFSYDFERYGAMRLKDMITYMGDPGKQLMYGTDWPLVRMKPYVKLLHELDFTDDQLENISWPTAATLFRIEEAGLEKVRSQRDTGPDADGGAPTNG